MRAAGMEKTHTHCIWKSRGKNKATATGTSTTSVTNIITTDMMARIHPALPVDEPVAWKPRCIWRIRCGRKTEETLPQPSTTAIPASPSVSTGTTKFHSCESKALMHTSTNSSITPIKATARFLPERMRRGSTGKRKRVVKLCLSMPSELYERVNTLKKTARGAENVNTVQPLPLLLVGLKRGLMINTITIESEDTSKALSCGSRQKYFNSLRAITTVWLVIMRCRRLG